MRFLAWLEGSRQYIPTCLFVVAPDVVGDAGATLAQYAEWHAKIKELGYPVAFAAQDGQTVEDLPSEFDALFIGGSTEWKLSPPCVAIIQEAQRRGRWVHVGRVNRLNRIAHCKSLGINSVDGTYPAIAPDEAHRNLSAWLSQGVFTF